MSFSFTQMGDDTARVVTSLALGSAAGYAVASAIMMVTMYAVAGALLLNPLTWVAMMIYLAGAFIALIKGIKYGVATSNWVTRHWDEVASAARSTTNWVSAKLA